MGYHFDLFVIGAGSGGVRAARAAASYGARVAVAEEHRVGGTCVIRGGVPKKLLVFGAHFAEDLKDARRFGWDVPDCRFNWARLRDNVLGEVDRLNGLYTNALVNSGVETILERATLAGPHEIVMASGRMISARYVLIATGARPSMPQIAGREHGISSDDVFHLTSIPQRVLIVGGGYIANEFAGIFNELGAKVTLVNRSNVILRGYDEQISDRLLQISMAKGIDFRFHAELRAIAKGAKGHLRVSMTGHDDLAVDCVLFATGRSPHTADLGLAVAGVDPDESGGVRVDAHGRSSIDSIYAIGDVTNRIQLTPVAIREGQAFADTIFTGRPHRVHYDFVSKAVFSHPPLASVGLTESEARQAYGLVSIYTSDFRPMKNVLAGREERALYKLVSESASGRVLGLHMIGPESPEILQAAAIAVKAGLTKAQFDETIALHPTVADELVYMK